MYFQNTQICSIYRKTPQSIRFTPARLRGKKKIKNPTLAKNILSSLGN